MITFDPGGGEPTTWSVCFSRKSATEWLNHLPVGKFKHVRAFGCVPHINTWVFFDPALNRTTITLARGYLAGELMHKFLYEAAVIQMPALPNDKIRPRLGGWCVPAVAQLLGVRSGALRPDTLFKHCLRQGGVLLNDGRTLAAAAAAD